MKRESNARRIFAVLLFLAIAATAWLMLHEGIHGISHASHHDIALDPGYQHAQRLQIAVARAAADVLGMAGSDQTAAFQADYHLQRMQIQADSEGLDRWSAHEVNRQGLLLEIRASLAGLRVALDQVSGTSPGSVPRTSTASAGTIQIPLLPALNRAESALSNYAASLNGPEQAERSNYMFARPVRLWGLMVLLLLELAGLAWVCFFPFDISRKNGPLL